jgi:hypothetical protein
VPHRRVLRFAATLLLVWIAFDLAAIDTCALDFARQPVSAQASVGPLATREAATRPRVVLHPDHCFCHGLSTGANSSPALILPGCEGATVPDVPPGHLLQTATSLYHPPQLAV